MCWENGTQFHSLQQCAGKSGTQFQQFAGESGTQFQLPCWDPVQFTPAMCWEKWNPVPVKVEPSSYLQPNLNLIHFVCPQSLCVQVPGIDKLQDSCSGRLETFPAHCQVGHSTGSAARLQDDWDHHYPCQRRHRAWWQNRCVLYGGLCVRN